MRSLVRPGGRSIVDGEEGPKMAISVQVANGVHFLAGDWPGVAVGTTS